MKKTNIKLINGDDALIVETNEIKMLRSESYNYVFNKGDGFFARWGKTKDDDDSCLSVARPEIADIEISTACKQNCPMCYKSNNPNGVNMSLETYKKILDKITEEPTITQVALGTTDIDANGDMWDIMAYTRSKDISVNITINGSRMKKEYYDNLAMYCGAVAVSVGPGYNKDNSYNSVFELTNRGMSQINIHNMICMENFDYTMQVIKDVKSDKRLEHLKSLVFLSVKTKGRAKDRFTPLTQEKFNEICDFALKSNVSIGFDSCSSYRFLKYLQSNKEFSEETKKQMEQSVEMCESGHFSSYIDCFGKYSPCSFTPGTPGWEDGGIDILKVDNFIKDVWYNERTIKFREKLMSCGRDCPLYKI